MNTSAKYACGLPYVMVVTKPRNCHQISNNIYTVKNEPDGLMEYLEFGFATDTNLEIIGILKELVDNYLLVCSYGPTRSLAR